MSEAHSALAHQFDDLKQQHEVDNLGMWVFLATEIMFFGGMFVAYSIYRYMHPEAFAEASRHLDIFLGAINTCVLIGSSLSMAMSVHAAHTGSRRLLILFLLVTITLGAIFLGIKFAEYHHKYEEGLIPGSAFHYQGPNAPAVQLFLSFYFAMTGMHALHMVIGIGLMSYLIFEARRNRFSPAHFAPVEMVGLYWHFVDIVWIFLFPILYLVDRHK